jgi:hypothetical protein
LLASYPLTGSAAMLAGPARAVVVALYNCGSSLNRVLRIKACIAIYCLSFPVPGCSGRDTLSSEVSALAHRAMPARMEYHVIQPRGYTLLARLGLETFDTADDPLFLDLLCRRAGLAGNR